MADPQTVVKLYRGMDDQWLADMARAFTIDLEENRTRGFSAAVKFCQGRLKLIAREQARREKGKAVARPHR